MSSNHQGGGGNLKFYEVFSWRVTPPSFPAL